MSDPSPASPGWEALSAAWRAPGQSAAPDAAALRSYVDRESRRMRGWLVVELALTAVALAGGAWALATRRDPPTLLLVADLWGVLAVVWGFALLARRGLWRPLALSTEAYLALARRRARVRLATAVLIVLLLAAQLVVVGVARVGVPVPWLGEGVAARALAAVVALVYFGWAVRLGYRAREEIRSLG